MQCISLPPLPPKHDFSHILPSCLRFTAESQQFQSNVVPQQVVVIQTNVYVKLFTPLSSSPREFFAMIARGFQNILKHAPAALILNVLWVVYIFQKGLHLSIFY